MASAERVFSGGRSSFNQKCSLLSQYLKERGSFGDLTLGLNPSSRTEIKETMDLLPKVEKPRRIAAGGISGTYASTETGQMTIFYSGKIMVFDNFPAEKAEEIMMLATKSSAALPPPSPVESATCTPPYLHTAALASDLPIKRKKSLARFLEKRRDRVAAANTPYQHHYHHQVNKPVKSEAWLGLAPAPGPGNPGLPFQIQRHERS